MRNSPEKVPEPEIENLPTRPLQFLPRLNDLGESVGCGGGGGRVSLWGGGRVSRLFEQNTHK